LYLIITMITISLILKYLRKNTTILDDWFCRFKLYLQALAW
jgi:hypothetical protein